MNFYSSIYHRVILFALLGSISCYPDSPNDGAIVVASSSNQSITTRIKTWFNTVSNNYPVQGGKNIEHLQV